MTVAIPLLNVGDVALVDEEDLPLVSCYRWRVQYGYRNGVRHKPASVVASTPDGVIAIHRLLLQPPAGMVIDHIDGSVLNNTRGNLRVCTNAENVRNRARASHNRSGVKGVYAFGATGKSPRWRAEISAKGIKFRLGIFETKDEAARAYAAAAIKLHGAFARIA